jgi:tetratricopeptide (TPR) repeat protein
MWRLHSFLKQMWGTFWALVLALVGSGLFEWGRGNQLRPAPEVAAVLLADGKWILLGFLGMGALSLWIQRDWIRHQALDHFDLLKAATKLLPKDLGFEVPERGKAFDSHSRPFHPRTYICRRFVDEDAVAALDPDPVYSEKDLIQALRRGDKLLLLGQPLEGKSYTLYELVKQMKGHDIVVPSKKSCSDDAFKILRKRRTILLLEDLGSYTGEIDLQAFYRKMKDSASLCAVAATCRAGPELGDVIAQVGKPVRRFYESIPWKLFLLPLTAEEKGQLARSVGKDWDLTNSDHFPTPGSITMEGPLEAMRVRFRDLDFEPEQRDTLRALKLLDAGGVHPLTHERLSGVLERVFHRRSSLSSLGDRLEGLANRAFLRRPGRQDPVRPEPAYLWHVVTYTEGKSPEEDFSALRDLLAELKDVAGLLHLGITWGTGLKDDRQALACFERALALEPNSTDVLYNNGVALQRLGEHEKALEAYNLVLSREPEFAEAWHNKGFVLDRLGRYPEAVEAYRRAQDAKGDDPKFLHNMAVALDHQGAHQEALLLLSDALNKRPRFSDALRTRGAIYHDLEQYDRALADYEQALKDSPNSPETWAAKGLTLTSRQRYEDALEAFARARELKSDYPELWYYEGVTLAKMEQTEKAVAALCQAWQAGQRQRLPADTVAEIEEALLKLGRSPQECSDGSRPT